MTFLVSCGKTGVELIGDTHLKAVTPKQALISIEVSGSALDGYSAGILYSKKQNPVPGTAEEVLYGEKVGDKSSIDVKLVHLECGTTYNYRPFVKKDGEYVLGVVRVFQTEDMPRNAIDLGLESDLLWADRNLGADSPEGYGDLYTFGETTTKKLYSQENYKFYTDYPKYEDKAISKYTFADGKTDCSWYDASGRFIGDGKTSLDPDDDVVAITLGGQWRMPKGDEFQELIDECVIKGSTQKNVKGVRVTSKNGKGMFLPNSRAADKFGERILECLYYRTSELWTYPRLPFTWAGASNSCTVYFAMVAGLYTDELTYNHVSYFSRHTGFPIRPVYDCNIEIE